MIEEEQISPPQHHDEDARCTFCGGFPNRTNRGGSYVGEDFYCKAHAALVKLARSVTGRLQTS